MVAHFEEQAKAAKMGFFKSLKKKNAYLKKPAIINMAKPKFKLTDAGLAHETEDGSPRTLPINRTIDAKLAEISYDMSRRCFLKLILRTMGY